MIVETNDIAWLPRHCDGIRRTTIEQITTVEFNLVKALEKLERALHAYSKSRHFDWFVTNKGWKNMAGVCARVKSLVSLDYNFLMDFLVT